MRTFFEKLKSRKFIMALLAAAVSFIKAYYPDFPDQALYSIVGALMGYVAIEGAVDAVSQLGRWLTEREVMRNGSTRE